MKVCGIDEAGRGPVVGPMVIAAAVFDNEGKQKLMKLGVRDSKKLSREKRTELEDKIKEIAIEWNLVKIYPDDIDRLRKKISLNLVEAIHMSELIMNMKCKPEKVIIDSPDAIESKFKGKIEGYLLAHDCAIPKIVSENKADDTYIEVSAASVLAKVERDREISNLEEKHGICIGSGYPSDEVTQKFLKTLVGCYKVNNHEDIPHYIRKSWGTVTREIEKKKQKKLDDY